MQFDIRSDDDYRMMIFYTDEFLKAICESDHLILDVTFYSAPEDFYQLYVFHFTVDDGFLPG